MYQINLSNILIEVFDILNEGWIGSLVGIVGIIIGLIVAFYFYHKSRIGPRLAYQMNTLKIIGKDERIIPDDVKIFFGDISVERLVKNKIIIWNSGYATFDGTSIIKSNPLRAEYSKDTCIMRVTKIKITRPENLSQAVIHPENRNEVIFSFDYLDPGDGTVFEIYHTGEENFPKIMGTIKGLPKGIANLGVIRAPQKDVPLKIINPFVAIIVGLATLFLFLIFAFFILFLVYSSIIGLITGIPKGEYGSAIFLLVPVFPLYLLYDYWTERRRFPKSLMTDELKN